MATDMATRPTAKQVSAAQPRDQERSVREIIAEGRKARPPARGAWLLCSLTAALMWASFTPLEWGPVGWLCLVPLILLVRTGQPTRWMYRAVYCGGLAFWLASLQWMRLGHVTMYPAWWALAAYLAFYIPVFVALARVAVHRFSVPLVMAVPVVWVGLEFVRAHLFTGFSWYYLGHTQYRWIELLQVSDLVGAYGVSFVMALSAAALAGLVPAALFRRLQLLPPGDSSAAPGIVSSRPVGVAIALTVFAAALGYGYHRRGEANFREGPRVALIQGNFPSSVKQDPSQWPQMYFAHEKLTGLAVPHQPDLIVWPESMFPWPLMEFPPELSDQELRRVAPQVPLDRWKDPKVREALTERSRKAGAAMIIGVNVVSAGPERLRFYNSAVFSSPQYGLVGRYDKLHRVLFGEYIPLKDWLPWLHRFTPFSSSFGIDAGLQPEVFEQAGWRFAPLICFEDTVPHLIGDMVRSTADEAGRPVDCLVNLTNDGWFHGSSELDQHLITSAFRAVECRTPLVRAVNTGISAIVDGDGVIREPDVFLDDEGHRIDSMRDAETGRWRKQLSAVLIDTIPLDDRRSFYVAHGDWFAGACSFLCGFLLVGGLIPRRRRKRSEEGGESISKAGETASKA